MDLAIDPVIERASVMFFGTDIKSKQVVSASLHSPEAECFIKKLYTSEIILEKIEAPRHLNFSIKWKISDERKWIEMYLSENISSESSAPGHLQLFNLLGDLLSTKPKQLTIETIGFGQVKVNFDNDVVQNKITMNKQWRNRVIWLLSQSPKSKSIPISIYHYRNSLEPSFYSEQDNKLLTRLLNATISTQFIGYFNSIINDCDRVLKQRKEKMNME